MTPFRALGLRPAGPPRPQWSEKELPDLTTLPERSSAGGPPLDALFVAPPREYWTPLDGPIPGRLIQGTIPDDPGARFLLRIPSRWDGRLVVAAAPGQAGERAYDLYWSDFLLKEGCAFACTDKGLRAHRATDGTIFIPAGPENGIAHWLPRLEALATLSAEQCLRQRGKAPERTYAVGISNGGYLARRAAERGGPFSGAVEVSGVLWSSSAPDFLTRLPEALALASRTPMDREALRSAGYPADPDWDPVLALYRDHFWENTLSLFLADLDPAYDGPARDYRLERRPPRTRERIRAVENTGALKVPLISLSGTRDFLTTLAGHAETYRRLVASAGAGALHRLRAVEDATHVDGDRRAFPAVRPLMPHAHRAFLDLAAWVERGTPPKD